MSLPAAPDAVPASLTDPGLEPLWRAVRQRLDRDGTLTARTILMPTIETRCSLTMTTLLGRSPTTRLDLAALEKGLRRSDIGHDLDAALTRLGYPPDQAAVERREARARTKSAHAVLTERVRGWPEAWVPEWAEELRASGLVGGLEGGDVAELLEDVRRLLDHALDPSVGDRSRAEVAAQLFGSAHALDPGARLASAAERALRHVVEPSEREVEGRALWAAAGFMADSVSAPALSWGLRSLGSSPLATMLDCAADGGLPLHLSLRLLREHHIVVPAGTPILVVENPSVVEAAMGNRVPFGLVCTNGNPSTVVAELIGQLVSSGAALSYHGDFDAAGIAICRRMYERGCDPWMMNAPDYLSAVEGAISGGIALLRDPKNCGRTPWDPELETAFDNRRCVVHEEFVAAEFLRAFGELAISDQ